MLPITNGAGELLPVLDIDSDSPVAFDHCDVVDLANINRYLSNTN